jgi:hypothetical protein
MNDSAVDDLTPLSAAPRRPKRTTVRVQLEIPADAAAAAARKAAEFGMGISEWVGELVLSRKPIERPGASSTAVALAAHRCVVALQTLVDRRDRGDDVEALVVEVSGLRRELSAAMMEAAKRYDQLLDERDAVGSADDWSKQSW